MNNIIPTRLILQATFKQAQHIFILSKRTKNPISFEDAEKMTREQASEKIHELHMIENERITKWYEDRGMRPEGHELWKI